MLLLTIIKKFGQHEDPDFVGHLLLEQYQAQFVSSVRMALDWNAGPLLLDSGLQLAAMIITNRISNDDISVVRRIIALMSRLLENFEDLQFPSYAEWVGCKVQVSLLCAYASIKNYACSCSTETLNRVERLTPLMQLIDSASTKLKQLWMWLLRDVTMLQMYPVSHLQTKYNPFLGGLLLPAVTTVIQPLLEEIWPVIFEALMSNSIVEPSPDDSSIIERESNQMDFAKNHNISCETVPLSKEELNQLWILCFSTLCQKGKQRKSIARSPTIFHATVFKAVHSVSILDNYQSVAFRGMTYLYEQAMKNPSFLCMDLWRELLQILICTTFQPQSEASKYIMSMLDKVIKLSPNEYFQDEEWVSALTEAAVYHGKQVLWSALAGNFKVNAILCSIFETLGILAQKLSEKCSYLLPIIFSLEVRFIISASGRESSVSKAKPFIFEIAKLLLSTTDRDLFVLASAVQGIAEEVQSLIKNWTTEDQIKEDTAIRLSLILDMLVALAQALVDTGFQAHTEISSWMPVLSALICHSKHHIWRFSSRVFKCYSI
ncbi:hypothetical protein KP509_1Z292600 [Ceratopteris richardii]|nr:hypothetical protein KP509_1Z292600 [Ceratopteris richardii]